MAEKLLTVLDLPSIAVDQILSYLSWEDKISTSIAVPFWDGILASASSWPFVVYENELMENQYFIPERRKRFLSCIKYYGQHIKNIKVEFAFEVGHGGLNIFQAISDCCVNLKGFWLIQEWEVGSIGIDLDVCAIESVCCILRKCNKLQTVGINYCDNEFHVEQDVGLLEFIVDQNLAHKITQLEVSCTLFYDDLEQRDFPLFTNFPNLQKLRTRRELMTSDLLLQLVNNSLNELTLVQEEELPFPQQDDINCEVWKRVMKIQPNFKMHLVMRYIMVIKENFSQYMPLRSLILDDLANIVTKGVLDHIIDCYSNTLTTFKYTNSLLENNEAGDKRLPLAIVDMVRRCPKFRTLHYGFPLSSTSVLLIAKTRKLKSLILHGVEISYENDWPKNAEWPPEFLHWLKECGSSERKLEETVSTLQDKEWKLTYDPFTLDDKINALFL